MTSGATRFVALLSALTALAFPVNAFSPTDPESLPWECDPTAALTDQVCPTWVRHYADDENQVDGSKEYSGRLVHSPSSDRIFALASDWSGGLGRMAVVAYEGASGTVAWSTVLPADPAWIVYAWAITTSPDGSKVFAAGNDWDSVDVGTRREIVHAIEAHQGTLLWTHTRPLGQRWPFAPDQIAADDDQVFFSSFVEMSSLNATTGAPQWRRAYGGSGDLLHGITELKALPENGLVVGGFLVEGAENLPRSGISMLHAADGSTNWTDVRLDPGDHYIQGIGVADLPSVVYAVGTQRSPAGQVDMYVSAHDVETGERLWTQSYDSGSIDPTCEYNDGRDIAVSPSGDRVYALGMGCADVDALEFETRAIDGTTGQVLWTDEYAPVAVSPNDALWLAMNEPGALSVSPGGDAVYVTGLVAGRTTSTALATFSLASESGERRWLSILEEIIPLFSGYGDSAGAHVMPLVMDPSGHRVYVGATHAPDPLDLDMITVAYAA